MLSNKTFRSLKLCALTSALIVFLSGNLISQKSPYLDKDYKEWVQLFINAEHEKLIPKLEKNLESAEPHPFVYNAWIATQKALGDIDDALETAKPAWKSKMEAIYTSSSLNDGDLAYQLYKYLDEERLEMLDEFELASVSYDLDDIDPEMISEALLENIIEGNTSFRTYWALIDILSNQEQARKYFVAAHNDGELNDYEYASKIVQTIGLNRYDETADKIELVKEYPDFENDAIAKRYLAIRLKSIDWDEEAAELYEESLRINPFYGFNLRDAADMQIHLRNFDKAEELIRDFSKTYAPNSLELFFDREWSWSLFNAGEIGKAREYLESKWDNYEADADLNYLMGRIENSGDYREEFAADYFREATEIEPNNLLYRRYLLEALIEAEDIGGVLDEYDRLTNDFEALNLTIYDRLADFYLDEEEYDYAIEFRDMALEFFPSSGWMLRSKSVPLNRIGEHEAAIQSIKESFKYYLPYSWSINQVISNLRALDFSQEEIEKELRDIKENHPWDINIWNAIADVQINNQKKMEVLLEGIKENPTEFGLYYEFAEVLDISEKTKVFYEEYKEKQYDKARTYNKRYFHNLYAQNLIFSLNSGNVDSTQLANAEYHFDQFLENYGDKSWYYNRLFFGYRGIDDRKKTASALKKLLFYEPDNHSQMFNLAARYSGLVDNSFKLLHDYVQRNPYDFDRWHRYISINALWGGSALNAIRGFEIVKERFPDNVYEVENRVSAAFSTLGSPITRFDISYSDATTIAPSERYKQMYLSTKRGSWNPGTELVFDWDTNTVTILFEDGTVAKRADDPINAKPTLLQVGNTFLRAEYDKESGDLTLIENSAGEKIVFEYNKKGEITNLNFGDEYSMSLSYDEETEKLSQMILDEDSQKDTVFVNYGTDGNISGLESGASSGSGTTLRITSLFQDILSFARLINDGARSISRGVLPDLGIEDENIVAIRYAVDNAESYEKSIQARLDLAIYLAENTKVDASYASEAYGILERLFSRKNELDSEVIRKAVRTYYELLKKDKIRGVDSRKWQMWEQMQEWVIIERANTPDNAEISKFYEEIKRAPIRILPSAAWLPKSVLQNTSYWKHYNVGDLVKDEYVEGISLNTILYRRNGDIVVGTNKGLLVNQYGYWEHLMYNDLARSFVNEVENDRLRATSDILSLTENNGQLFVGTADGLIVLDKYKERSVDVLTTRDDLPSDRIEHLESSRGYVYVGNAQGAAAIEVSTLEVTDYPNIEGVSFINVFEGNDSNYLAIGTNDGVFVSKDGQLEKVTDTPRKDGLIAGNGVLYLLTQDQVSKIDVLSEDKLEINLTGELVTTDAKQVFGLGVIPVYENEWALSAYTDLGLSIFHEQRFEHFYVDVEEKPQVRDFSNMGMDFGLVTNSGISIFEYSSNQTYLDRILEVESFDELGLTFYTDGNNPKYIFHNDPNAEYFELDEYDYLNSTSIAKENENNLIINDGSSIIRYTFNTDSSGYDTEELFFASPTIPESNRLETDWEIQNIKVDSSGVIWVATSLSVFKYEETNSGKEVTEFSFFKDPERFPCNTDLLSSVQVDGSNNVYVVCSDEGHRSYNGKAMEGGLLIYERENDQFQLLDSDLMNYNWFINSITNLGNGTEIMGTNSGFALKREGEVTWLRGNLGSESYKELMKERPSLFFGTKGANIGDVWLFGSAAGVVGFYDDIWFYPEQLNRLLPKDIEFGNYGGRHINDLVSDPYGRLYIATDLGLLVYDSGSSDPTQFLMENFDEEKSIEYFNTKLLEDQRNRIISLTDLPDENQATKILNNLKENERAIQQLNFKKETARNSQLIVTNQESKTKVDQDSLQREIDILNQRQNELLLTLEQREPAIFQAIQIDPLDLKASRNRMEEGDVIVQYIPMPKKLYIQLISKGKSGIYEVNINREELIDSINVISSDLAYQSENLRAGDLNSVSYEPLSKERFNDLLSYLYERLLRPVEISLEDYENVYIAPVSSLNYIPFAALIDKESERKKTYAIEKFNIGYVSSLYLFQLITDKQSSGNTKALFFGDPDGSLPGAREEVELIQSKFPGSISYYGNEAKSGKLMSEGQGNGIIHFATHGYLNDKSLKDSWLLFSDKKMKLSEIYNLNLTGTSMVVLSACETSLGGKGLEYATLARAFVNTGVPTILGTLWKVDDEASKELMVNFYSNLSDGKNKFQAMAEAQRLLIASNRSELNHPSKWAAYIVLGKP